MDADMLDSEASDPSSVALSSSGVDVVVVMVVIVVEVEADRDPLLVARSRSIAAARSRAALGAAGKNCAKPAPDAGGIAEATGGGSHGWSERDSDMG